MARKREKVQNKKLVMGDRAAKRPRQGERDLRVPLGARASGPLRLLLRRWGGHRGGMWVWGQSLERVRCSWRVTTVVVGFCFALLLLEQKSGLCCVFGWLCERGTERRRRRRTDTGLVCKGNKEERRTRVEKVEGERERRRGGVIGEGRWVKGRGWGGRREREGGRKQEAGANEAVKWSQSIQFAATGGNGLFFFGWLVSGKSTNTIKGNFAIMLSRSIHPSAEQRNDSCTFDFATTI